MKHFLVILTFLSCLTYITFAQTQSSDVVLGHDPITVPASIQSLVDQITDAETDENWDEYTRLREELIQTWESVDPAVASIYKRTTQTENINYDDAPQAVDRPQGQSMIESFWGNDLMVHAGGAEDISLVSADGDTLYLAALQRNYGSSDDTVYIYRSANGGDSWTLSGILYFPASEVAQIELLDFYGPLGPSYLLLFSRYTPTGRIWVTRIKPNGSIENFIAVNESAQDFAVDRNYPGSNYRAIMVYDSSGVIRSVRSEPTSYASVWQDNVSTGTLGRDVGFAYGYNGSNYLTFNGGASGNLYLWANYNYADPTSWAIANREILETGNTDTTKQADVVASRHDTSAQTIAVVYTHEISGTENLRWARKTGGSGWTSQMGWVTNNTLDFKQTHLYSRRVNGNDVFQAVFVRSELNNFTPRQIRYKKYESGSWSTSIQISDDGIEATGLQNPVVVQLPSGDAAFAYAGSASNNVYFDREDWVSSVNQSDNKIPESYTLFQNYPNPFNPSTAIKYSIPTESFVNVKVYNLIGQEVAELVNQQQQVGNYEISFEANNLPSGIYFYSIKAGNFAETKKMMLVK